MPLPTAKIPTVITSVGGSGVAQPTQTTPASPQKPRFVPEHIDQPKVLTRLLNDLVSHVDQQTKGSRASPLSSFNIREAVTFTAGQTLELQHMLGRPCTRWLVIDAQTNDWSGRRVALSAGKKADEHIAIRSTNAGTYSFLFF